MVKLKSSSLSPRSSPCWVRVVKPSHGALVFKYFWQFKPLWLLLWGSTSAMITPTGMCQPYTCGQVLAPGPKVTPSAPKQRKSDVHVQFKTLSELDCHWRNPRGKKLCSTWLFTKADCSKIFTYWFRIIPDIVSKLLLSSFWSCCDQCAVLF